MHGYGDSCSLMRVVQLLVPSKRELNAVDLVQLVISLQNANQVQDSPKSPIRVLVIADPQVGVFVFKFCGLMLWFSQVDCIGKSDQSCSFDLISGLAGLLFSQITDRTSYGMKPGSLALWLTQFYSDIYMRRAFRTSVLGLEPEQIVFLGDLFDGGPFLSPKECVVVFCWSFCFCFEKKYPCLTCCFSVLIFFLLLTADGKSPWSALDIYLINHKEQSRTEVGKRFQCIHSLATMIWAMKLCKPKFLRLRIFSCHP